VRVLAFSGPSADLATLLERSCKFSDNPELLREHARICRLFREKYPGMREPIILLPGELPTAQQLERTLANGGEPLPSPRRMK
jgi:hypothetical protein